MQISIKTFNELMKEKHKFLIKTVNGHQGVPYNSEGSQGDYNETFKYYRHEEFPENIFLKETSMTDSYGEGDSITGYMFVTGKEKQITVFEPI